MKLVTKNLSIVVLAATLLSGCDFLSDYFSKLIFNRHEQVLSESSRLVKGEWLEITPTKHFETYDAIEKHIMLNFPDVKKAGFLYIDWNDPDISGNQEIPPPQTHLDNVPVNFKVEIISTDGKVYKMNSISSNGGLGFTSLNLPDVEYSKVRILSDLTIENVHIMWMCVNGK